MYDIIKNYIKTETYNLDDLTRKIDKMFIEDKLTEAERDELILLATENARDSAQVDLFNKIVDLEHRIVVLESAMTTTEPEPVVWYSGYVTKKHEVVKYDYDNDGTLDLLRYDGGRNETALKPGKIDGWHVVDKDGNILGTFYQGEFTPVDAEEN